MKFAVLAIALLLAGCATNSAPPLPAHGDVILSRSLAFADVAWRHEAAKRFPNGFRLLVCHGGDIHGLWQLTPDTLPDAPTETVVAPIHQLDPLTPLIVISCNPGHYRLHIPNVYYADDYVWTIPDSAMPFPHMGRGVGSIWQFHQ